MDSSRLIVWLVAFLATLGGSNCVLADINLTFPNIFQDIVGKKDGLRFQYEINTIDDRNESRVKSVLIDESYSFRLNTGRMLIDDGGLRSRAYQYEMFYWIKTERLIESFMLHPFICSSSQTSNVDDSRSPFTNSILANLLPKSLTYLFEGFNLSGISALMANIVTHFSSDLRLIETDESGEAIWMLDTQTEYAIEFRFADSTHKSELNFEDNIANLRITIFRSHEAQNDKVVARATLLKAEYEFNPNILELPEGYSCRRAIEPPEEIKYHNYVASLRTKYTYLVSVTAETDLGGLLRAPKYRDQFSVMKPLESMSKPKFDSAHIELLHDRFERTLSIKWRRNFHLADDHNEAAISSRQRNSSLSVWDFNAHLRYLVNQRTCEQPIRFESSLFGGKTSGVGCKSEGVQLHLSNGLSLKLNQETLDYVLFALQDRKNYAQLIDVNRLDKVSAYGFDYELVYEMAASESSITKCLSSSDAAGQQDFNSVRLITRYYYSVARNEWRPIGSSLMFFDETHRKLMLQIDLNLLEMKAYAPWRANNHLIDLSQCKLGLKQSAKLELEFPLANDLEQLKRVTNPHEAFRAALAGFLQSTYKLSLIRIPSVRIEIIGDLVRAEIRLLERESALVDSERVEASCLTQGEYLEVLRSATRSSLLSDQESCANYCQHYLCKVFVFCKLTSSCYIFSKESIGTDDQSRPQIGSFQSMDLSCESHRISSSRFPSSELSRESWSLDEILESLVFSVNQEENLVDQEVNSEQGNGDSTLWAYRKQISRPYIQISSYLSNDSTSQSTLTLSPTYAHYTYDNLDGQLLTDLSHIITSEDDNNNSENPFSLQKRTEGSQATVNFQIALSGFKFVKTNSNEQHPSVVFHQQHYLDHLDLEDSRGYLVLDELKLDDCIRVCLNELTCSSFSHCASEQPQCIITQFNRSGIIDLLYIQDKPGNVGLANNERVAGLLGEIRLAEDARCSIMRRTYSDQFEKFETRMLSSYPADQSMEDVVDIMPASGAEDCATNCVLDRVHHLSRPKGVGSNVRQPCLSYDFCRPMNDKVEDSFSPVCVLFKKHLISSRASSGDSPISQITNRDHLNEDSSNLLLPVLRDSFNFTLNSFCSHFVRNFLYDFHKINMRKLPPNLKSLEMKNYANEPARALNSADGNLVRANHEIVEDISLTNCAQLCEEDPDCGAFEYCIGEHLKAPKGLLLVCSLGSNETLRMAPIRLANKGEMVKKRYASLMLQLQASNVCSVYTYKSLSLVLGHKRKNSRQVGDELIEELDRARPVTIQSAWPHLKRLDLLIGLAFFIIGCAVRSLTIGQFSFGRLQESGNQLIDQSDERRESHTNRWSIGLADRAHDSPEQRVQCLHEDQVGKFDWRRQYIGIPKFVYKQPNSHNLIIGTESNVVASIHTKDGSIIWRHLLPKGCILDHMSVLKSNDAEPSDYLVRTSCSNPSASNHSHYWNPQNGLLATRGRYEELALDDSAESILSDQGHAIEGRSRAFAVSDDSSLVVAEDGRVMLKSHDQTVWSREEALATVVAVEIVKLPTSMRDRFGLKKMIVLVTEVGKLFGIDTFTGEINWELFDSESSTRNHPSSAILTLTRQSDDEAEDSRAVVIYPSGFILHLNPVTGSMIEKKKLPNGIKQVLQTEINALDNTRGVILLDTQNKVHVYPETLEDSVKENIDKYYMTIVERASPLLQGYKFILDSNSIVPKLVWAFPINETEKIINLGIKRIDEEVHSPARVLGDRGILYKYINPNLIAVMTQGETGDRCSPDYYMNIYLIDAVTGALVHSVYHPKSRGPANMVHSENWLVYSYFNTKSRRTEMSSLEMFEGVVQTNSAIFSSLARAAIRPKLVEHKSFIFPGGIDAMVDTVTLRGMTNRHIIVALPSGSLLEIPKIYLDPRRPINMLLEHREEGLIPYMPELPIPSEGMINYDQSLLGVRKITTSPAILESTSLVFAYGLDLFFTRVTPSHTFDILKDDFDHLLITGVLIFLVVASYVSKLLAQRKALRAAWK